MMLTKKLSLTEIEIELNKEEVEHLQTFDFIDVTVNGCRVIITKKPTLSFGEPTPRA